MLGAILVVAALCAAAGVHLFGSRRTTDDYWGETTIRKRWGTEREMVIDRNLDGIPDMRVSYPGTSRTIATHDRPSRLLIDNDLDGVFEIEWRDGPPVLRITSPTGTMEYRGPDAELPSKLFPIPTRQELGLAPLSATGT